MHMKYFAIPLFIIFVLFSATPPQQHQVYYPASGENWERKKPEDVGMDSALLQQAVAYAESQETKHPRDYSNQEKVFGKLLGPIPKQRGGMNGIIIRNGYIVAEFGDTNRVEPTYSAAKNFLSTLLGVAVDRGLIKNVHDPVKQYINDGGYDSPHNSKVTWEQHVQQTSEWDGEMFGKPSTFIGAEAFGSAERKPRELKNPGEYYEYNDVRVNRFSLSLMRMWKRPLPEVLKTEIMDPIGASNTWQWIPYFNSEFDVDGKKMNSVSGGTRWGGGLWISTRDEARFGYLFLRNGKWRDKQLISQSWILSAITPSKYGPDYGYLWWLNTRKKENPDVPISSYSANGFGSNTIWVDPEHDLVVVWRWHNNDSKNEFFKRIIASIKAGY